MWYKDNRTFLLTWHSKLLKTFGQAGRKLCMFIMIGSKLLSAKICEFQSKNKTMILLHCCTIIQRSKDQRDKTAAKYFDINIVTSKTGLAVYGYSKPLQIILAWSSKVSVWFIITQQKYRVPNCANETVIQPLNSKSKCV